MRDVWGASCVPGFWHDLAQEHTDGGVENFAALKVR